MSSRVKEHQDHTQQSIFHHGLIKLIISIVLQKKGKNWYYFLFCYGFQSEKEDQSKKRHVNKAQNLLKKLKKEVIVEAEEDSAQERSMTQKVENLESEQHNKADEDEPSKVQRQDLNHVANTLNEELN